MRTVPLLLAAAVLAAGCAAPSPRTADGRLRVLAAAYPFAWLTAAVAGPDARVVDLVRGGGEPHDVELSPRQVGAVEQAALVVYVRGFQPAVQDAVVATARGHALDLTRTVPVRRDGSGIDPHIWLDPVRMQQMAGAVRDRLTAVDAAHADGYRRRAAATVAALGRLDDQLRRDLTGCARRELVTAHTAFAYLAERYGLRQVGVAGLDPESEPTPARVAEVIRRAGRLGVRTIFFESPTSPGLARTVAREIGARTAVLDPVERVGPGEDYLSVMRRNGAVLRAGLDCR